MEKDCIVKKICQKGNHLLNTKNTYKMSKYNKIIKLICLISIILFTMISTSCTSTNSQTQIDMREVGDMAEKYDALLSEQVKLTQKEKYDKHYQNNLYYEDLSKYQEELNKKFKQYWTKIADDYIQENIINKKEKMNLKEKMTAIRKGEYYKPIVLDWDYFISANIEFINQDVKKYSKGELKAEDIITNPDSIMSMDLRLNRIFDFEEPQSSYEREETDFYKFSKYIMDYIQESYKDKGIDFFRFTSAGYTYKILEQYSLEELRNAKDIQKILSTLDDACLKYPETKKNIRLLEEKYNKEFFYYIYGFNYAPKDNPDLYFSTYYYEEDPIIDDVYLGIMYQYELNKYIRKMIDDAGLTDKVLF